MTDIAPHITAFLRQRLEMEQAASSHTRDTYAYAFQLLFDFASRKLVGGGVGLGQLGGPERARLPQVDGDENAPVPQN